MIFLLDFELNKDSAKRLQNFRCQYEIQSYKDDVLVDSVFFYDLNEACSYFEQQFEDDINSSYSHKFFVHSQLHLLPEIRDFYKLSKEL